MRTAELGCRLPLVKALLEEGGDLLGGSLGFDLAALGCPSQELGARFTDLREQAAAVRAVLSVSEYGRALRAREAA